VFELDPASQVELDEFCAGLSERQANYLRLAVERVCRDPSGRRQPTHRYTRPFANAQRYVPNLPDELKVWEFKTNHYRALFVTAEVEVDGRTHRHLSFLPIGGRGGGSRFLRPVDCPWPH
jgi:hypothetical protein